MNDVIAKIRTAEDRSWLFDFLDKLQEEIFNPGIIPSKFLESNAKGEFLPSLKDYFFSQQFDPEDVLSKIKLLKNELSSLTSVTLNVAKFPDQDQIEAVKRQFAHNNKPVLVEFLEDRSLIGGAVIEINGWIIEHSFRDYFEKRGRLKSSSSTDLGALSEKSSTRRESGPDQGLLVNPRLGEGGKL